MSLAARAHLGPYEILSPLGAGGMMRGRLDNSPDQRPETGP